MAEELQHLIEKIQTEAIDKADKQAADMLARAKEKAARIVREAEQKADHIVEKARKDAEAFTDRSTRTLEQAGRDLLITVGQGVEHILDDLIRESLEEAMSIDVVKQMLVKMADSYMARGGKDRRMDLLLSEADQKELVKFYSDRYKQKMGAGVEIKVDPSIDRGFKVSFVDDHAHHDFTKTAIAEALANFLRPHLADIILRVAREGHEPAPKKG